MLATPLVEVAIVLLSAGVVALLGHALRQPPIVSALLTGVLVGQGFLGWTTSGEVVNVLAQLGITLLLFLVGLNLNWRNIRDVGGVALATGAAQVVLTSALGAVVAHAIGFAWHAAVVIGIAFAFSSTIVVVKLLSDKEDLDRLYGRIAVGILIVQDFFAIALLLALAAWSTGTPPAVALGLALARAVAVGIALWLLGKYIVPHLFRYAAQRQELLFLLALAWCFGIAAGLAQLGLGMEAGALIAGIALAGSGFQKEIEGKVRVLRDFFLIVFFTMLGTQLSDLTLVSSLLPVAAILSAFVLVGNPLIAFCIMRVMGHHPRTGFLTSTALAQVSEFSFIFLGAAATAGLVTHDVLALATMVGLFTIAGSSYLVTYNERLFEIAAKIFPWLHVAVVDEDPRTFDPDIVLVGCDYMGQQILPVISQLTDRFLVLDVNPAIIERLEHEGVSVLYGDAGSEDVVLSAHAHRAKLVIATVPDMVVNADLLDILHRRHFKGSVIVTAKSSDDAVRCYQLGATFVIIPSMLGGEFFAAILKKRRLGKQLWKTLGKENVRLLDPAPREGRD